MVRRMTMRPRVLLLDNAIDPAAYRPHEHWGRAFGRDVRVTRSAEKANPPALDGFTHLVITGSEASIVDDDPWISPQTARIREAADREMPILASCHGHQMLALALGGQVRRSRTPELGWYELDVEPDDPMFRGAEKPVRVFSSHFDEVAEVPDGFVVTARTERCAIHAFRHPTAAIWGVQSHPEIDPPTGEALLRALELGYPAKCHGVPQQRRPRDSGWIRDLAREFLASGVD